MTDTNGWPDYAKHVLAELKRHDKWLGSLDLKMDNHITTIEHRLTQIETNMGNLAKKSDIANFRTELQNMKRLFYVTITGIISIFGMVLVLLVV